MPPAVANSAHKRDKGIWILNRRPIMATISQPQNHMTYSDQPTHTFTKVKASRLAVPLGRTLFSLIFIMAGMNNFSSGTIAYAAHAGVPMADIMVPISGVIAMVGGLSVMLGFGARIGAALLILFLVPVTLLMHNFWNVTDPAAAQLQMVMFMKNLSMLGGAILIAFYGAGPVSIDNLRSRMKT